MQRCDLEKTKHIFVVTSDVRRQIAMLNRKSKDEWEKRTAEKLKSLSNVEVGQGSCTDREKGEGRLNTAMITLDKTRTTIAIRNATGGCDLLSKWQKMSEQAKQKRELGIAGSSASQLGCRSILSSRPNFGRTSRNQEAENRGFCTASTGITKNSGRRVATTSPKVTRNITIKDVISALEREPQMCRSALLYRLYERERLSIV